MQYLMNTQISGDPSQVEIVRKLFMNVRFGGLANEEIVLTLTKVLPNCSAKANLEKHEAPRVYVVVPDREILKVWPGHLDVDETKLTIATREDGSLVLTQAFAMRKEMAILYLCLSADFGELIEEGDSLGI